MPDMIEAKELYEHLFHDLQQRLAMSTRTNHVLVSLLQTHALNLEHCEAAVETLLSPCGTPVSASSLSATTESDWRTPGPQDTPDTLTRKLNHALTELRICREQLSANGSQDSIPSLAEAVRSVDESSRRSPWVKSKQIEKMLDKRISSVNLRPKRRKRKT